MVLGWPGNDLFQHINTEIGFIFHIDRFQYVGRGVLSSLSKGGSVDSSATFAGVIVGSGELLTEVPTRNEGICFDGDAVCFETEQLCGPVIDL